MNFAYSFAKYTERDRRLSELTSPDENNCGALKVSNSLPLLLIQDAHHSGVAPENE